MTTNDTRTQLEAERREKVARAISAQGWSCEMHEPDYYCSQCQPLLLATADAAIEASGLPLRNAQVEMAWEIVELLEQSAATARAAGDVRWQEDATRARMQGMAFAYDDARTALRRAIEEAGA